MTKSRRRSGERRKLRRQLHDTPLDKDGLPILDAPDLSLRVRYAVAVTRYMLAVLVVPRVCRHLTYYLHVTAIVDDVMRRVHRDYEIGRHMTAEDFEQYFDRYAQEVEGGGSENIARAWENHAERLLVKYGPGLIKVAD